jgi:cobalamin biosynthesis protein CobD/CbiB
MIGWNSQPDAPMSFLSILVTLLIEQVRPLAPRNAIYRGYLRYVNSLGSHFNAGEQNQGTVAWLLAVLPWVLVTMAIHYFLLDISIVTAWIFNVAILYLTMGFRQFSHAFTRLVEVLRVSDLDRARLLLTEWRGDSAAEYSGTEIAKVAIEQGLIDSHRHVFGVIFWFLILPGPSGAVLYRMAGLLEEKWGARSQQEYGEFGKFAQSVFHYIDWIPVRLTAISFAIAGDFEDAVYCWRSQATTWMNAEQGVVLASGAGALGVRLGETLHQHGTVSFRPDLGLGDDADVNTMTSAVGMIWRALVIWMFILALMTVARWVGI